MIILIVLLFLFVPLTATAFDDSSIFSDTDYLGLVLGQKQTTRTSPITATVIDEDEILGIPALTIEDVFITTPGFHISKTSLFSEVYSIRGLRWFYNPSVLTLVDGTPTPLTAVGGRSPAGGGPLSLWKRFEIQRSPGSAIHGADALAGVINTIPRTPQDVSGGEIGINAGSYNAQRGWLLYSTELGEFDTYLSVGTRHRDNNDDLFIESDGQTVLDNLMGTNASLAPGRMETWDREQFLRYRLQNDTLFVEMTHNKIFAGRGAGVLETIQSSKNRFEYKNNEIKAKYKLNINKSTSSELVGGYRNAHYPSRHGELAPPGAFFFVGDGPIRRFNLKDQYYSLSANIKHSSAELGTIIGGIGYNQLELTDASVTTNITTVNGFLVQLPQLVTTTGAGNVLRFIRQENSHIFIQHEKLLAPDLTITYGIRWDYYNTIGGVTSPRAGLVWNSGLNATWKLLYGRAFRPPSLIELHREVVDSDRSSTLVEEQVDTVEISNITKVNSKLTTTATLYNYRLKDIITTDPNLERAVNYGIQEGYGAELEAIYKFNSHWTLRANHTQIDAEINGQYPGLSPKHMTYARLNWTYKPEWITGLEFKHIGKMRRPPGDDRNLVDDYNFTNFIVRRYFGNSLNIALIGRDIFNSKEKEPSSDAQLIYSDIPLSGRTFYIEAEYSFNND